MLNSYFGGNNLTFAIEPSDPNFEIQQVIERKSSIDLPIRVKRGAVYTEDTSWKKIFTFYGELDGKNQIYIAQRNGLELTWQPICELIPELNCYDIKFIREDQIIMVCFQENQFRIYLCQGNMMTRLIETNIYQFTTLIDIKLSVLMKDEITIIMAIISQEMSLIKVYNFVDNKLISNDQLTLTSESLSKMLDTVVIFQLTDIQIDENYRLYVLDSELGVLSLDLQKNAWLVVFRYYNKSYRKSYRYLSFSQANTKGVKYIFIFVSNSDLIYFLENDIHCYYETISFREGVSITQISNTDIVYVYDEKFGVFETHYRYQNEVNKSPSDYILVNSLDREILLFSSKIEIYEYSTGFMILKYDAIESQNNFSLVATGPQCSVKIAVNYQLFAYTDTDLYRNNYVLELPSVINYPSDQFSDIPVTGSNIQLAISYDKEQVININTRQYYDFPLGGVQLPADIIYVSIFPNFTLTNGGQYHYYFIQTQSLQCKIYRCFQATETQSQDCVLYTQVTSSIKLDDNLFQWQHQEQNMILAVVQKFKHVIKFYVLKNFALEVLKVEIQTNFLEPKEIITGIRMFTGQVFVLMQAASAIQIYKYEDSNVVLQFTITQTQFKDAGYDVQFSPLDVVQNKINIYKYIIVSTQFISFVTFVNTVNIIEKIECLQCKEIRAIYIKETIALLFQKQIGAQIDYYDCSNYNEILLTKTVYLPYYRIQQPFQIFVSQVIDGFLLRVMSPVTRSTIILVINIRKLMREQVVTYIDLGIYVPDKQYISMNVADKLNNILLLACHGKIVQSFQILIRQKTRIQVASQYRDKYFTESTVTQTFYSIDSPLQISNTQSIVFVNQLTDLWVNPEQGLQISYIRSNRSQFIDIDKKWFSGQIMKFEVTCQSCLQEVFIKQVIQEIYTDNYTSTLADSCQYNNELFVILSVTSLYFQDQDGYKVRADIQLQDIQGSKYIKLICEEGNNNFLIQTDSSTYSLIVCLNDLISCRQLDPQRLPLNIYQIQSFLLVEQNLICILSYSVQNILIVFYRFQILQDKFEFLPGKTNIELDYWGRFYSVSLRNAVCYKVYRENTIGKYRILIDEITIGLLYFDAIINSQGDLIPLQQKGIINLGGILLSSKYNLVMFRSAMYLNIAPKTIIQNFTDSKQVSKVQIIMLTQSLHVCLTLQFNIAGYIDLDPTCILADYAAIFDRHSFYYLDDYLVYAFPYYPISSFNIYRITHYDNIKAVLDHPNLLTGGVEVSDKYYKFCFITKSGDEYKLFYNRNETELVHNKINKQAQIVIRNALTFPDQPLTLIATNTKTKPASLGLKIRAIPEESISKTIFWMIGTLLGIIIVGLGIWCIYRLKLRNKYIQIRNLSD